MKLLRAIKLFTMIVVFLLSQIQVKAAEEYDKKINETLSHNDLTNRYSYCGKWLPFSGMYGVQFSSRDVLIVSKDKVTLPGCLPVRTRLLRDTKENPEVMSDSSLSKPMLVRMIIEEPPKCKSEMLGIDSGSVLEIRLRPRGMQISDELEVNVFKQVSNNNQTKMMPMAGWWAIRPEYNPCDEGNDRGMFICASIDHRIANDELNNEWNKLIKVVEPKNKSILIAQQKQWLKACSAKCSKELSHLSSSASVASNLATELLCLSKNFKKRSQEFRNLNKCIKSAKKNCKIILATKP